ncbi:hypothetical protein UREG_02455 [Uncinocarpus reesii 1704]|uniref:Orotate phosphoribosyltransferase n=1 Tax=Uncinocarpus reesii (strain UAMH 1704) TaxID=336963 RepID=C4JG57_UNCRE|nr:uncharacterized protein UREG_02455 [Uncinocarpus reesii 1704]EEP77606.1 hypothetical protein UREG_02455 [Uncinocarpus reesii 1704]
MPSFVVDQANRRRNITESAISRDFFQLEKKIQKTRQRPQYAFPRKPLPRQPAAPLRGRHTKKKKSAYIPALYYTLRATVQSTMSPSPDYKTNLLSHLISNNVLSFGSYTLKSGRNSPYFFTTTLLHTAPLLHATASACATVLSSPPFVSSAQNDGSPARPNFDIIFGPAYKGIPLCTAVLNELGVRDTTGAWDNVSYSFNRKEAKAHGEGGNIVGAPLKGKKVVIIDDVITAGTALREAVGIIEKEGGTVVGVLVLLDREERVNDAEKKSAVGCAQRDLGGNVPVRAVLGLSDIIDKLGNDIGDENLKRLKDYRAQYGAEE